MRCARAHYWQFEIGLTSDDDSAALRFGSAWHRAMEALEMKRDPLAAAFPDECGMDELQVATLTGLLIGYQAKYGKKPMFKRCYPEIKFEEGIFPTKFNAAGIIDGLVMFQDGSCGFIERKTTSDSVEPQSDYWLRLRFNYQLLQYYIAARNKGWNISKVIYDVVRKPQIQPKQIDVLDAKGLKIVCDAKGERVFKTVKGKKVPRQTGSTEDGYYVKREFETHEQFSDRLAKDCQARPDFYFARREVAILADDVISFEKQRIEIIRLIEHYRLRGQQNPHHPAEAWPRAVSENNCQWCSYATFCLNNISINPQQPPQGLSVKPFNPELQPDKL